MSGPHLTWVPHPIDPVAIAMLAEAGDVALGYGASGQEYRHVAPRITGVLLRSTPFDAHDIESAPRLEVIARHGVGVESIDLAAARRAGVPVTITAGANAQSVAEHVFALLLAVTRHVVTATADVRAGRWASARPHLTGVELAGRRLGLLGCGRIGRRVAGIGRAFGMTVLAHDPVMTDDDADGLGVRLVDLGELLRCSDVVSLHAPLTPTTRHVLDDQALGQLPPGAVVVNTSRGELVDHDALVAHLDTGRLAGAALDVTDPEPLPADHPLCHRADVVLTPHLGAQSTEAMRRVATSAATSVLDAYAGRPLRHVVAH